MLVKMMPHYFEAHHDIIAVIETTQGGVDGAIHGSV